MTIDNFNLNNIQKNNQEDIQTQSSKKPINEETEKKFKKIFDVIKNKHRLVYTADIKDYIIKELKVLDEVKGKRGIVKVLNTHPFTNKEKKTKIRVELKLYNLGDFSNLNIKKLKKEEKLKIIEDLLYGISALHAKNIIHHDIKPKNIVIHKSIKKDEIKAALIDFECCCFMSDPEDRKTNAGRTLFYHPPEYSPSADHLEKRCKEGLEEISRLPEPEQEAKKEDIALFMQILERVSNYRLAEEKYRKAVAANLEYDEIDAAKEESEDCYEDLVEAENEQLPVDFTYKNTLAWDMYGLGEFIFKPLIEEIKDEDQNFLNALVESMVQKDPKQRISSAQALKLFQAVISNKKHFSSAQALYLFQAVTRNKNID